MSRTEVLRDGKWALVACSDTDPAWVGWVHDSASVWLAEVVRIAREGVAAGIEAGATPGLWATQTNYTRDLVTAINALALATNTPPPSFGPWAERVLAADVGPDPWPGWGFTSPGEWRYQILETVALGDQHVRDALIGDGATAADVRRVLGDPGWSGNLVFDQLAWRVWPRADGSVDARYLLGLPPTTMGDHTEDYHENNCAPSAPTGPTAWSCVGWSVWSPGVLDADRNTWFNAIAPLGWEWTLARNCADELRQLGTVDRVMARCRAFQNTKNVAALNYLRSRGMVVNQPEDLLAVISRDQAARLEVPQSAVITRQIGTMVGGAVGPVGIVIVLATALPELLYQLFGQAYGRWQNPWGEREPAVARASLSGVIDLRHPSPPTQTVPTPRETATATMPGAFPVLTTIPVADVIEAVRQRPLATRKKSSAAVPLALGAALLLLAK